MGVGILVLLLLIIGIGSALKAPSTSSSDQTASGEKSIDLAGNATDQANGVQPAPGTTSAENTQQDVSLPPISSTPTQGQTPAATDGQQRVEVQGDLNNALTQPQNSTLPTEPATVAPVRNGNASRDTAKTQTAERPATTRPARQQAVIEPKKPQATVKTEPKPVAQTPKRTEPAAPVASTKAPAATSAPAPKETATTAPVQTASPAQTTATPAAGGKTAGNVGSLKSAPSSHYTLQLSSSSNYDNLNGWAKKRYLHCQQMFRPKTRGRNRCVRYRPI